ncbi:MAG TPA: fused MFS/spermidine synthase [Candidatus Limnocylindrales bacterium]|nr:fused MFS/spermidine synthase [Candidatus Limnocylindrales bacterium]
MPERAPDSSTADPGRIPAAAAAILAFVPSAVTLLVEVVAIRLLAPRIGSSIETYTAAIGVVLAGLAAGAYLGGKAADAFGPRRLVGPVLLASAALVALVAPAIDIAAASLRPPSGALGATILALAGLLLPSIVLAAATPLAARGSMTSTAESGSVVGRISAIATVGALLGTFLTGFVLLAVAPVRTILIGAAVVLALTGLLLHLAVGRATPPGPIAGLALATLVALTAGAAATPTCDVESSYYCIRIGRAANQPAVRDLVLDDLIHGSIDLDEPETLRLRYLRTMDAVIEGTYPVPRPLDALHIGGGAFALPRHLVAERPGTTNRVLELDPAIVRVNREILGLELALPEVSIRVGDARSSLFDEPASRYDLVIADVFAARAVPWHLVTREAIGDMRRAMAAEGIYVANVIDGGELRLLGAYVATLRQVFPDVAVAWIVVNGGVSGNVIVIASDELPTGAIAEALERDLTEPARLATDAELAELVDGAPLLTDDFAPTDALISR